MDGINRNQNENQHDKKTRTEDSIKIIAAASLILGCFGFMVYSIAVVSMELVNSGIVP